MNLRTLVIAPHPDDEILGCGGTLLRRKAQGGTVGWMLMTTISEELGWDHVQIQARENEVEQVRADLGVDPSNFYRLGFPAARLECEGMSVLIAAISKVFKDFKPEEVLLPYPGDVHSDHRVTFAAVSACTKWFRYPSVKRVLAYETLSETDFGVDPRDSGFRPNLFVDITDFCEKKVQLLKIYGSEIGQFPFPRSEDSVRALAKIRGCQAGFEAAESFMLLFERT